MLCKTRQDMYDYLNNLDFSEKKETEMSSVYFLIRESETEEMVYFMPYNGSYFESPCVLREWKMKKEELREYVEELYKKESWDDAYEYEKLMQIGDMHYEIDNFQCEPYLKENIEIVKMVSESECLRWLLQKKKEKYRKTLYLKNNLTYQVLDEVLDKVEKLDYNQRVEYDVFAFGYNEEITNVEILINTFQNPLDAISYAHNLDLSNIIERVEDDIKIQEIYYFEIEVRVVAYDKKENRDCIGTIYEKDLYLE